MLLFDGEGRRAVCEGRITLTFRAWVRPHVKEGGVYGIGPGCAVRVYGLSAVAMSDITDDEARRSGFAGRDELLVRLAPQGAAHGGRVYRVEFELTDVPLPPEHPAATPESVAALRKRLAKIDASSATGPWTMPALRAIAARPRTAARHLAPELKLETLEFKARVRRLKALGLTQSFEVGYELTELGRAVLLAEEAPRT